MLTRVIVSSLSLSGNSGSWKSMGAGCTDLKKFFFPPCFRGKVKKLCCSSAPEGHTHLVVEQ